MAAICQICGAAGFEECLIFCSECGISAEHSYCGHKSENWKCEVCDPRDHKILSPGHRRKKKSVKHRDKVTYCVSDKVLVKKRLVDNTGTTAVKQADESHVPFEPNCQFSIVDTSEKGSLFKIVDASNVVGFSSKIEKDKNFKKPRRRLVLAEEDESDEDNSSQDLAIPPTDKNHCGKLKRLHSLSEHNENANVPLTDNHGFNELERSEHLSSESDEGKKSTKHRRRLILPDDDQVEEEFEHEHMSRSVKDRRMEVPGGALELKETCKNQSESYRMVENEAYLPAMPIIDHVWRGNLNISNDNYGPVSAHLSNRACIKVWETASLFPGVLKAEEHSRLDAWPNSFKVSPPNEHNIGLYFFPYGERAEQMLTQLIEDFIKKDIALMVTLDNAELLIFTSTVLPEGSRRFRDKFYLWGVFRGRKDLVLSRPVTEEIEEGEIIGDPGNDEVCEEVTLVNRNDDEENTDYCLRLFPLEEESIAITSRAKIDGSITLELELGCTGGSGAWHLPHKRKNRIVFS